MTYDSLHKIHTFHTTEIFLSNHKQINNTRKHQKDLENTHKSIDFKSQIQQCIVLGTSLRYDLIFPASSSRIQIMFLHWSSIHFQTSANPRTWHPWHNQNLNWPTNRFPDVITTCTIAIWNLPPRVERSFNDEIAYKNSHGQEWLLKFEVHFFQNSSK